MVYIIMFETILLLFLYWKANNTIKSIKRQNEKMETVINDMAEIIDRLKAIIRFQGRK